MVFTYPNDTQFIFPVPSTGGSGTITSVNGDTGPAVQLDAVNIPYDNTTSGLTATDVQGAIDEIVANPVSVTSVEYRAVTAPEDAAKQLTLSGTPASPTNVRLGIAGAPTQVYGLDFTVSGAVLSWSGTALDGVLATGDELVIVYET
jgi:hypothetical protein